MQPIVFPLNTVSRVRLGQALGVPPLMASNLPRPTAPVVFVITGTTKDSAGAALTSCSLELMTTVDDRMITRTISDATTGAYSFSVGQGQTYYIVAYKTGSPDVAGTTVNTLIGA